MKRISVLLITILLLLLTVPAYAHPGKTDANGGHYNRSTGEYHYHHGHPAHQHPNGVCPYDFDDRTGYNSGTSSSGSDNDTFFGSSGSGSSTPYSQHSYGTGDYATSHSQSDGRSGKSSHVLNWFIMCACVFFIYGLPCLIGRKKHSKPKPRVEPTKHPNESPPIPPEPPKKRPHRLDLSDRFEVICGFREVTLYGLPAVRIFHVGYLRDTRQLLIRFRDDNSVLLYDGVPLDVCSEFVRSSLPDQYYEVLIDGQFPAQRIR